MTPLLVATNGFIPCGSPQKIATNGFIGVCAQSAEQPSGGFWFRYEQEQYRRQDEQKQIQAAKKRARESLKNKLDQELALELIKQQEEKQRTDELTRLTKLADQHQDYISRELSEKVAKAARRATLQYNYSAMEALERELQQTKDEEEFLLQSFLLLMNQ